MPQFDFARVFLPQLVWLLIFFAILYFGIVQMTLPKLGKTMTAREDKVTGDIAAAEAAKGEADSLGAAYAEGIDAAHADARAAVNAAKAKASAKVEAQLAELGKTLSGKIAAAEASLDTARAKAFGEIEAVAGEAAGDIVERLTGKRPDAKAATAAAKEALA